MADQMQTETSQPAGQPAEPAENPRNEGKGVLTSTVLPADSRESYSVLEGGEVVAIAVARHGEGPGTQLEVFLFDDERAKWEAPDAKLQRKLVAGLNRYEEILRRDPDEAARMRMRADNKVDGQNAPEPEMVQDGKAAAAEGELTPEVGDLITGEPAEVEA